MMMFNLRRRTKYPLLFVLGCLVVAVIASFFLSGSERMSVTVSLLTAVGGLTAFLYSNHSQQIQLFRELFREFNARYDALNANLIRIRTRPPGEKLQPSDLGVLSDYFNLCAEEYLYAAAGCLDARVWRAWQNGMRYFAEDPEILEFWLQELRQDSYYGFTIPK